MLRKTLQFVKNAVERVLVFGVVHLIYFLGGLLSAYIVPPVLAPRAFYLSAFVPNAMVGNFLLLPFYHLCALGFAICCGLFGPWIYDRYTMRGRGELAAIRAASARKNMTGWQRVEDQDSYETWRQGVEQEESPGRPEHRAQAVARDKSPQ